MKKSILILLSLVFSGALWAEDFKPISSPISEVRLYLKGAQLFHDFSVTLETGQNEFIIEGVSPFLQPNTLQLKSKSNLIVLELKHETVYPEPTEEVKQADNSKTRSKIQKIDDSLKVYEIELGDLGVTYEALDFQKKSLKENQFIKNDSLEIFMKSMDYLEKKYSDLQDKMRAINKKRDQINIKKTKINARKATLNQYLANIGRIVPEKIVPVQQVKIVLHALSGGTHKLTLNYLINKAGWSPIYDLRADDANQPMVINYKAQIYQQSGLDWKNVKLSLSSANPNEKVREPILPIWNLSYVQPIRPNPGLYGNANAGAVNLLSEVQVSSVTTTDNVSDYEESGAYETKKDYKNIPGQAVTPPRRELDIAQLLENNIQSDSRIVEGLSHVEFDLKLPYSLPSDGKAHMISVSNKQIPTEYYYLSIPKVDQRVYLVARTTNWEGIKLLPASANIYYEGSLVGNTTINPNSMSDTLEFFLGIDKGIMVTRKKQKDERKEKGGNAIINIAYDIDVKSTKSDKVKMIVRDQIPISNIEDIKISLGEKRRATYDEKTGRLEWDFSLAGKGIQKVSFDYEIKYEKDKKIIMR